MTTEATSSPAGELLSRYEAAEIVGVSPERISVLAASGRLRVAKQEPGEHGRRFFRRSDAEEMARIQKAYRESGAMPRDAVPSQSAGHPMPATGDLPGLALDTAAGFAGASAASVLAKVQPIKLRDGANGPVLAFRCVEGRP